MSLYKFMYIYCTMVEKQISFVSWLSSIHHLCNSYPAFQTINHLHNVDHQLNLCRQQNKVPDTLPQKWTWPVSTPSRVMSTALELSCLSYWQDVGHLTGTLPSSVFKLSFSYKFGIDDQICHCMTVSITALDPGQSSHLCGGQHPSCMTSMHWTGWSILHSRVYTQPNLYPDLLMSLPCVSR